MKKINVLEVVVIVVIILVLGAILFPIFSLAREKASQSISFHKRSVVSNLMG